MSETEPTLREVYALVAEHGLDVIVEPMDAQQIADLMGVTYSGFRSRKADGRLERLGFPEPARSGGGRFGLWHGPEVRAWLLHNRGRL